MLAQQTVRSPNAYSAHTRLLSIASLVRVWLSEPNGSSRNSPSSNHVTHTRPVSGGIARSFVIGSSRRRSFKSRSIKLHVHIEDNFYQKRRLHSQNGTMVLRACLAPRRVTCVPIVTRLSRKFHTNNAHKPEHQSPPSKPLLDPDRSDEATVSTDRGGHGANQGLTLEQDVKQEAPLDSRLSPTIPESSNLSPSDTPNDLRPNSTVFPNRYKTLQDLPPLVQQLTDLDYDALPSEETWSLWEEINSLGLIPQVPTHFIIRFAGALADDIQNTPGEDPDPRLQRLDYMLDHFSTSRESLGYSNGVKLASVRVQRALLHDLNSVAAARTELDTLLSYESHDTPGFLGDAFRALRLIVQAQPDLSNVSEMLIDYWDLIYRALIGSARFTDRTPGAFHEASSLREVVWKVFANESNVWLWLSDRFSHCERIRGERLALLVLAFAAQHKLAPETVNTYDLVSKLGVTVPPHLLRETIKILIQSGEFSIALNALDVDARNQSKRKDHYRLRMRLGAAMGDSDMAENVYKLMDQLQLADDIDRTLLLQADAIQGNAERTVARFNEFFTSTSGKPAFKPNIFHFSAVISAFARSGDEAGASEWLKRMAKTGIPPDGPLYNMILRTFALRNDITSVAGVLKRMHKLGIRREIRTITILVSMYARRSDPESAERVIRKALDMPGFVPDRMLLNSLLSAHVNAASWRGVIRVFDWMVSMKSFDLRPEIDTMNNVLKAYVYMGAPFTAVSRTFAKIKKLGLRPNARSYLMLIQSACDTGRMDAAWDAFNELERTGTKQHNPVNAYILTLIMGGYLRNGDKIQAKTIYEEMQARGIQPTAVSFRVILSAYSNERTEESLEAAEKFMSSLLESSPRKGEGWRKATSVRGDPIMTVFAPLLVAHGRSLHPLEVEAKFRTMLELGAEPSVESFTLLMDAYRRVEDIESVVEAWEQLYKFAVKDHHAQIESNHKSSGPPPLAGRRSNVVSIALSIFIDAVSHAGRHQDIARVWQMAKKDGFSFDSHNWNHLAVALVRAGEPQRAFEVVERILIPYSQYTDRAVRARNRTSPSLLTEDDDDINTEQLKSESTAVKPRARPRVMRSLIERGVDSMLEEEETDPTDLVQALHILQQISPAHNLWTPHERTLVELAAAARRLKQGLMVTARGPNLPIEDVHSEVAYTILDQIKQESPNALYASLVTSTRMRNITVDDQDTVFTSDSIA